MKISFFGTSDFALPSLKLLAKHYEIVAVYTSPPKKRSRNKITKTNVHILAESLNIPVFTPESLSDIKIEADIGIVISYGLMIPQSLINQARYGFLNLHPSNLPLFRGASPIERTLESGAIRTAICVIKITAKLDAGDIVSRIEYDILPSDDSAILHDKFSDIGAQMLRDIITNIDSIQPTQQIGTPSYAKKIEKSEITLVENIFTCEEILNKIRAFKTRGCARIIYNNSVIKILSAYQSMVQMSVIDIKCSNGFIVPELILPEGKNVMLASEFCK